MRDSLRVEHAHSTVGYRHGAETLFDLLKVACFRRVACIVRVNPQLTPSILCRSHPVGMRKVMGSSLIMHKEPKTQGGLRNSKRMGGAGSHTSTGGAGEQDAEEVNLYLVNASIHFLQSPHGHHL